MVFHSFFIGGRPAMKSYDVGPRHGRMQGSQVTHDVQSSAVAFLSWENAGIAGTP